ncbi:MAG: hypothetical protein COB37_00480 [Kordiimonadales bacterium]|nr:MAG: hypothetical protein COB37_00480 [Kordiimonadales bacterium]
MEKKKLAIPLKKSFWGQMRIALAPADELILHSVGTNYLHPEKEQQSATNLSKTNTKRHPGAA